MWIKKAYPRNLDIKATTISGLSPKGFRQLKNHCTLGWSLRGRPYRHVIPSQHIFSASFQGWTFWLNKKEGRRTHAKHPQKNGAAQKNITEFETKEVLYTLGRLTAGSWEYISGKRFKHLNQTHHFQVFQLLIFRGVKLYRKKVEFVNSRWVVGTSFGGTWKHDDLPAFFGCHYLQPRDHILCQFDTKIYGTASASTDAGAVDILNKNMFYPGLLKG